jgi:uncharacterized protein YndB with AHSA1/START domain
MYATYESIDERPTLRFERRLAHPVEAVWSAITTPERIAQWFPTAVSGDMREHGHLTFTFEEHQLPPMEGEVTEFDPPLHFAFWWGEDHLRFELSPAVGGTQTDLRFTVELGTADKAARDGAGWHVCLDRLAAVLGGGSEEAFRGATEGWLRHYEEYERRGFPASAEIPGADG